MIWLWFTGLSKLKKKPNQFIDNVLWLANLKIIWKIFRMGHYQ